MVDTLSKMPMARIWIGFLVLILVKNIESYNVHKISSVTSVKNGLRSTIVLSGPHINATLTSERSRITSEPITQSIFAYIKATFLPAGFPEKTPNGYLSYAIYSWLQDLSTQLRGVLAAQRLLEGVGVGREGATALSALLAYLVRDGFGMLATLLFTSISSTTYPFRYDVKRWRLFADLINDVGITLEVMTTLVPRELFLPMICVGNMCKAMCGVAAGATGGNINLHWSKGSDISDINAKFGAQNTVTGSLGLLFAALFAKSISTISPKIIWSLYSFLTGLHIFCNMRCMQLIAFDYLNTVRTNILIERFIQSNAEHVMTPNEIARLEPLFFLFGSRRRNNVAQYPIRMGVSFHELNKHSLDGKEQLADTLQTSGKPYAITLGRIKRAPVIFVSLLPGASQRDCLEAYFLASLFGRWLGRLGLPWIMKHGKVAPDFRIHASKAMKDAITEFKQLWPGFVELAERQGWSLDRTDLKTDGYVIELA